MKKCFLLAFVTSLSLFNFSLNLFCQTPEWTDPKMRLQQFNEASYLVGYASEINSNNGDPELLKKRLERYARSQISEYIQVTVSNETKHIVIENGDEYYDNFKGNYSSFSDIILTGLNVESMYDKKTKRGYAIATVKKDELFKVYLTQFQNSLLEAESKLTMAEEALKKGNAEEVMSIVNSVFNYIGKIEKAQIVLIALKKQESDDIDSLFHNLLIVKSRADVLTRSVQRNQDNTLDDVCFLLAKGLSLQFNEPSRSMALFNFTFQDTKMGSQLSTLLNQTLHSKLLSVVSCKLVNQNVENKAFILTGTYWKEASDLKLIATIRTVEGNVVAASEAFLPLAWIEKSRVSYLPENFDEAFSRMKVFSTNEIIKGDLNVEIWTNKGVENLIYTEFEKLKIYIRANKECYIRLVYYLANGQSVLLYDNYYIAAHMCNQVVQIPDEFECAAPFGAEILQINAQTQRFDPLSTNRIDGYHFIENTVDDIVVKTRGFKRNDTTIDKAEKRLIFTTVSQ